MKDVTLTVPQRKVLAEMLVTNHWNDCLWKVAKQKYEESRNSLKMTLIREASVKAKDLLDELETSRQEVRKLEEEQSNVLAALSKRGFLFDSDGDIDVKSSSPLSKSIEKRLDSELGTLSAVVTLPFERARVKLWTVATAEEAERIIEPFLNFEVKSSE